MKKILLIFIIFIFFLLPSYSYAKSEETLIIFDASVSMLDDFEGQPKYLIAANKVKKIIESLPNDTKIGLRTIGARFDSALISFLTNPDELCKATNLVSPINIDNIPSIKSNLDTIFPLGTTPLTYSLEQSINNDFTPSRSILKRIILITDGADSCNGDPCKFIRNLMATRSDIVIDIIAIGVNAEDFAQLKCLSDETQGNIFNATIKPDLDDAFDVIFNPNKPRIDNNRYFQPVQTYNNQIKYKNYLIETTH